MTRRSWALLATLAALAGGVEPLCGQEPPLDQVLTFEAPSSGDEPAGWGGGPPETIHRDGQIVHGGEWSARLERDASSPAAFTALTAVVPADVEGRSVELRGWLRTEELELHGALWMRIDGPTGTVAFDNMGDRALVGTNEWTEASVELELSEQARTIYFGAMINGAGKLWVDDLELLVDGRPYAQASKVERPRTVLETDTEFDGGSGVELDDLAAERVESLVLLGKVWGFLKYHHPRVASGERHWDYDLFRVLPAVLAAEEPAARNRALLDWVRALGPAGPCGPCAAEIDAAIIHLRPNLAWIRDRERLGDELSAALVEIHDNRFAGTDQFFVGFHPNVGNPGFDRELPYRELAFPDDGYRLLAVYRFWNIIESWFPYRDVLGEEWDDALRDGIRDAVAARDRGAYERALIRLIARVHDTHANLWSSLAAQPPLGACRAPFTVRFVQDRAVVVAYRHERDGPESGVRIGDVVASLDGRRVDDLVTEWEPLYPASNRPTRLRDIARNLTRGECGALDLVVEREGRLVEVPAARIPQDQLDLAVGRRHDRPGETFQLLSDEVAYLKLSSIATADVADYVERAARTRGLVVDIRNYPSEFVVFELGGRLVKKATPFARFTRGRGDQPGAFVWGPEVSLPPRTPSFQGKVVILVDEVSQSQAEYTTMALRSTPNAVVVGSTTAGADGNVSPIPLPGGLQSLISGIGVFYPDRTPTQRVGIVPDIVATPTVEGIRERRDEVLERALRVILPEASEEEIQRMARPPATAVAPTPPA